jgi:hypothetical protein
MSSRELQTFFVLIRVGLRKPILTGDKTMRGYYQNLGVSAYDAEEAKDMILEFVEDGRVDWLRSEWIDFDTVLPAIKNRSVGIVAPSIWYKSERAFFTN